MKELLSARSGISRLVQVKEADVNLSGVLASNPDHAHWAERKLPSGQVFNTRDALYSWLFHEGLPRFALAKVIVALGASPKRMSKTLFENYFAHHGIHGVISVSGEGLLDYHTGVRIDVRASDPDWNPLNAADLIPEIDFRVGFDYPTAPSNLRQRVHEEVFVLVNNNKVEGSRFRPCLDGRPIKTLGENASPPMKTGRKYIDRVDTILRDIGLPQGFDGMVITDQSRQLIELFEANKISR